MQVCISVCVSADQSHMIVLFESLTEDRFH